MCTGRDLMATVARARLPYAENLVSETRMHAGRTTVCARSVPVYRVRSCGEGGRRGFGCLLQNVKGTFIGMSRVV
jgi:hypothetical protein